MFPTEHPAEFGYKRELYLKHSDGRRAVVSTVYHRKPNRTLAETLIIPIDEEGKALGPEISGETHPTNPQMTGRYLIASEIKRALRRGVEIAHELVLNGFKYELYDPDKPYTSFALQRI